MSRRICRASDLLLHVDAFVNLVRETRLLTLTHLDSNSQHRYTLQTSPSIDENERCIEVLAIQNLPEVDVPRFRVNRETTRPKLATARQQKSATYRSHELFLLITSTASK